MSIKMVEIPCDYHTAGGRHQDDGTVLIYGEIGGPPPRVVICPECKGTNKITVPLSKVLRLIGDLEHDIDDAKAEITELRKYLKEADLE